MLILYNDFYVLKKFEAANIIIKAAQKTFLIFK